MTYVLLNIYHVDHMYMTYVLNNYYIVFLKFYLITLYSTLKGGGKRLPWSWSYCSWIYIYLCNQWRLLDWILPVTRYTQCNLMWKNLLVNYRKLMVVSRYSCFNKIDHHKITEMLLNPTKPTVVVVWKVFRASVFAHHSIKMHLIPHSNFEI